MAVSEGRYGKVTVCTSSTANAVHTIAELGSWSLGGMSRNMIDVTAFGDTVAKFRAGMLDPGTLTFSGFADMSDSTGQVNILSLLNEGTKISNDSTTLRKMRLWVSDSTAGGNAKGFFSCTGSSGEIFITSMDVSQDKNNVASITFNAKISKGALAFSAST